MTWTHLGCKQFFIPQKIPLVLHFLMISFTPSPPLIDKQFPFYQFWLGFHFIWLNSINVLIIFRSGQGFLWYLNLCQMNLWIILPQLGIITYLLLICIKNVFVCESLDYNWVVFIILFHPIVRVLFKWKPFSVAWETSKTSLLVCWC